MPVPERSKRPADDSGTIGNLENNQLTEFKYLKKMLWKKLN